MFDNISESTHFQDIGFCGISPSLLYSELMTVSLDCHSVTDGYVTQRNLLIEASESETKDSASLALKTRKNVRMCREKYDYSLHTHGHERCKSNKLVS